MKKKLLYFLALAITTSAWAQITISNNDLPTTSGIYIRDNAGNTSIIDLSVTGPNTTWDYSALSSNGIDTIDYMTVASTNFAYQLYFNNPFSPDYDSDLAVDGADFPSIPLVPITITDVVNYFKIANNDGYYQTGFGASISGIPASVKYDPRDKVLPLPCTFGLTQSNQFEWLFEVPALGAYGQRKTRTVEVDGWGTLMLPNGGNYDVLRVKSTIDGLDTIYVDQLGFGFAIPGTQTEYRWYAQGEGEPVLSVNESLLTGKTANHKHHENTAGIFSKNLLNTELDLFPNPTHTKAQIKYYTPLSGAIRLLLFDITGNVILQQNEQCKAHFNNCFLFDVSALPQGFYTLQIQQAGSISSTKMIVN
jgi:hypothetical protein